MMNQKRQPKGMSIGGQFAASVNPESTISLDRSSPMLSSRLEVQNGEVFDTVLVDDGSGYSRCFHRRRPGVFAGSPYSMRFQVNRRITDDDARHLAGLVGYAYRSTIAGESIGSPEIDSPFSFIVSADMTKSSRDDLGMGLEDFEAMLPRVLAEGSPIRKTDRAGVGTKGTRLIDGFGPDIVAEIYYDDAFFNQPQEAS